jgi:hypothetical protein
MDMRRLLAGLGLALFLAGLVLACFTPGGWLNRGSTETVSSPLGSITVTVEKSSAGPVIGYVLLGLGAVALVGAFAMKPPPPRR